MIQLTESQEADIIRRATGQLVSSLIAHYAGRMDFISPAQAGGILDLSPAALKDLPIPRYVLSNSKIVRYKLSEILSFIQSRREG